MVPGMAVAAEQLPGRTLNDRTHAATVGGTMSHWHRSPTCCYMVRNSIRCLYLDTEPAKAGSLFFGVPTSPTAS